VSDRSSALARTPLTTAADALRDEEVDRTRKFIRIGWAIAAGACLAALALPGNPRLAQVLVIAVAATAALSGVVYRRLTDASALRSPLMTLLALACTGCGVLAMLYSGYFAGAPLMMALGVYFFCRTEQRVIAVVIFVVVAGSHAVLALLIMTGVIADPGFAPLRPTVNIQAQLAGVGCAMFGYGIAFWLARSTRAASLRSIESLQQATRMAAMRLAQLDEARDDLDRALKVGGPGQFTRAVVGSWELGFVLGRGGMGEVYEATHVDTDAPAAVKLLRRELLIDKTHVERFLREVRAASALDSPHVVRTLEASGPDDPVPFLAMERLRGDTLSSMLRGAGTLDRVLIVELVQQLGRVLELARAAEMVHRDIKPPNIFRTDEGVWKLLDFGVAALGDSSGTLTQGGVVGTPGYMAPEQAKGEAVDHRADVYAVGAVVYRCLTGRAPFGGPEHAAVLYAMVHDAPIRPGALGSVPLDVERVLAIALAKQRTDRFATAAELADALTAAFAGRLSPRWRAKADALLRGMPWRELETAVDAPAPERVDAATVRLP
jgi:serine/threonine-protein kinase